MSSKLRNFIAPLVLTNVISLFIGQNFRSVLNDLPNNFQEKLVQNVGREALLEYLCHQDLDRLKAMRSLMSSPIIFPKPFSKVVMDPLQSTCHAMKRIGGKWKGRAYDGGKMVCMDDLDLQKECLIYSFGVGNDTTFEEAMLEYGCEIHAYDHTMSDQYIKENNNDKLKLHKQAIAAMAFNNDSITTFEQELKSNGHQNRSITYLKMDIEGKERPVLLSMAQKGLLKNVAQIGAEFHEVKGKYLSIYLGIMEALDREGFKLISFDPNLAGGMSTMYPDLFEVAFRKTKLSCE